MIRRFICRLIGHDITVLNNVVRVCRRCEGHVLEHYRKHVGEARRKRGMA